MQISGAQIIVQSLHAENVEYVFGYPGGAVLEIYDAIYQLKKFKHILTRHEQAAVHAADAYSRSSGKVGVALVTSGPGATNAITGIATAYSDSIPLVVISGQVPSGAIGTDAFQEIDMIGISRPCVKHNFLVTNIEDLAVTIKKAFQIAKSGRPGPVAQVANVTLLDARTIGVKVYESNMAAAVEKAIRDSNLGLNPAAMGDVIRVPMPMLTEERRKDLIKVVRSEAEDGRVSIRNVRRDANDHIKKLLKDKEVSEDEARRGEEAVQKLTDKYTAEADKILAAKEEDLMAV